MSKNKSFSVPPAWRALALLSVLAGGGGFGQAMAAAGVPPFTGTQCPADRYGSKLVCTANDVRFGGITAGAGAPTTCVAGGDIELNVNATVTAGSAQRYNIGIFFGSDGKDIQRLSSTGGNASCSTYTFPTSPGPVLGSLDGNACGDTMTGGSVTVPLSNVILQCAPGPDGKLLVPALVSWQQAPSACVSGDTYPVPGTTSKCNASTSSTLTTVQPYAKLTIKKITTSGDAAFGFTTSGTSGSSSSTVSNDALVATPSFTLANNQTQVLTVPYGAGPSASITVSENYQANWAISGVECWTDSSKTTLATNVITNVASGTTTEGGVTANFNAVDQQAYCEITNKPYTSGQAALEVIKTHSGSFLPGSTFAANGTSYTVTVKNIGNGPENNPQFEDVIPAGITVTGYTTGGNTALTCSPIPFTGDGSSKITCSTNGSFKGGDVATVTFQVSIADNASGLLVNRVTAKIGNSLTGTATDEIRLPARPIVEKTVSPSEMISGGASTLTISLGNPNAFPITLTDDFVDDLAGSNMSIPDIAKFDTNCPVTPVISTSSITYPKDAWIPAEGCVINVTVTATSTGTNQIPANALKTDAGQPLNAASATLTITSSLSAPGLSKSFVTSPINPGGETVLQVTLTNTNNTPLVLSSDLEDLMPDGLTLAADPRVETDPAKYLERYGTCDSNYVMLASGTSADGAQLLYTAGGSIPANSSCYVAVKVVAVKPTSGTTYTNTIDPGSLVTQGGPDTTGATATLTINSVPLPDMEVAFLSMPATATVGVLYTGTFTCENVGDADATIGTSCDLNNLPAGVTRTGCTISGGGDWDDGDPVLIGQTVTCTVSGTPTAEGPVTQTVTTDADGDSNPNNNSVSQTVAVAAAPPVPKPDMVVNISGLPNTAIVGVPYIGQYTCKNEGDAVAPADQYTICNFNDLPTDVTVDGCSLDGSPWTNGSAVGVGKTVICTVSGTPTTPGVVTQTATTGATGDKNPGNNSASQTFQVLAPDMAVDISGLPNTATVGVPYTGTYTCTNVGDAAAAASPPGTICNFNNLPADVSLQECTLSGSDWDNGDEVPVGGVVTCTVSGTPTTAGAVTQTATTGATGDIVSDNNTASQTVTVGRIADLAVLKNAPVVTSPSGDLTYTVTISNAGASGANGAVFADAIPAGMTNFAWSCDQVTGGAICPNASGSTAINETIAIFPAGSSLTYTITGTAPATGSVTNTATLTAPTGVVDPDPTNNTDVTNTALSQTPLPATADLSVTKYGPTSVAPNSSLTFKLLVANAGYIAADRAQLSDAVPAGLSNVTWTCQGEVGGAVCPHEFGEEAIDETIATFPAGSSLTYLVTGTVDGSGTVNNQVSLTPPVGVEDPDPSNNNDSSLSTVEAITEYADLSVIKIGPASVANGQSVSYQLLVANAGTSPVTGARVVDRLPSGLTDVTWTCANAEGSTGGVCQEANGTGDIDTLVNLPVAARVSILVTANAPATGPAAFANVAEVFAPQGIADLTPDNNLSSAVITQLLIQPVANNDYFTTLVNTPVTGQLADNDSVPTGSVFSLVGSGPANGELVLDPETGEFTFTPNNGWTGVTTFTYQICLPAPNQAVCDSALVTISIPDVVAANNGATTTSGNPNLLNVLKNVEFDGEPIPEGQALIEQVGTWPNGLSVNQATGQVGVAPGTPLGNYQVKALVCKKPTNVLPAFTRSVANLTQEGQCALVTLDINVTPAIGIPTLSEWGRLVLAVMLLGLALQSRRVMLKP